MSAFWRAVLIGLIPALISGAVSGWIASTQTITALSVNIEWIKKGLESLDQRVASLERKY